jgi:hypothetical protein
MYQCNPTSGRCFLSHFPENTGSKGLIPHSSNLKKCNFDWFTSETMSKRFGKLLQSDCVFFSCDIQTNFMKLMHNVETVQHVGKQMAKASKILNIPLIITEQYPSIVMCRLTL